jgi:hypothetical protein
MRCRSTPGSLLFVDDKIGPGCFCSRVCAGTWLRTAATGRRWRPSEPPTIPVRGCFAKRCRIRTAFHTDDVYPSDYFARKSGSQGGDAAQNRSYYTTYISATPRENFSKILKKSLTIALKRAPKYSNRRTAGQDSMVIPRRGEHGSPSRSSSAQWFRLPSGRPLPERLPGANGLPRLQVASSSIH